ncbi:S1C family serine protease [Actinomadura alba]|uniref:S1C family serine protease n=1 Tax=Actinomadura alba TaxID=406431 RepID=UPI0028AFF6DC|nr:trypsin-like peptidase domain-containing protein [Actinomadura alba]
MSAVVALALGAGAAGAVGAVALTGQDPVLASPTVASGASSASAGSVAKIAAAVQPSVVSITARSARGDSGGSGVILRSDGVILTNAHVVDGASQVVVKFSAGKSAPATILGKDPSTDIAVIKATGVSGLKPATLGDSGGLAVGDSVLALGSPLGLDGSVTSGIVSALGRTITEGDSGGQQPRGFPFDPQGSDQQQSATIPNAIQTDAAINPGNSGGALVNASGQVIGINTAIVTTGAGSGNIGVGFAIPINSAKKAADAIIKDSGGTGSA